MLTSIALDALLVLILLMMIPLGFLRGGLREVCTGAGLLFGILLAEQWSHQWGSWIAGSFDITEGTSRFLVAVVLVVLTTSLVGYGSSAAFAYRPGPGGRMYGAYIALFNGIVFIGYLINTVIQDVFDGDVPTSIDNGFVSRALSVGFGWILLVGAFGILVATVFGMFVRERPADEHLYQGGAYAPAAPPRVPRHTGPQITGTPAHQSDSARVDQETAVHPAAPVRIREVRHWEEDSQPQPQRDYGGGWRQTWPDHKTQGPSLPWVQQPAPKRPSSGRVSGSVKSTDQTSKNPRDVLREWIKDEKTDESH